MPKEFVFTRADFDKVREIVLERAGIQLGNHKFDMVYGRLARRLRQVGLHAVKDYLVHIEKDTSESINFINAITTNLTYFFREKHHFEFIETTLFNELQTRHSIDKRVRIWSAGCSTGEEPYSLAMTLQAFVKTRKNWDVKILATDLDTNVLTEAKNGLYSTEKVQKLDPKLVKHFFESTPNPEVMRVKDIVRSYIYFKQLNLMQSWPMNGLFDLIICRNVLIYFNKETQQKLIQRYYDKLHYGGYLMLGHSESLGAQAKHFKALGKTIFQKVSAA